MPATFTLSRVRTRQWLGAVLLAGVTLAAYLPALTGGMLWDDEAHVTPAALQSVHGLWRIWFELGATQQYYPVLHTAFWLEHRLWGDASLGYHLWNVGLHTAAALLVVAIVRKLSLRGGWLAGFLFALHPVCVESVAWISEQKNTLSAVFYLGAALAYLRYREPQADGAASRSRRWYAAATFLFFLALATKTVTATLPAVLLVAMWWRNGRVRWRDDVVPLLPWLTVGIAAGLFTAWIEQSLIGARGDSFAMPWTARWLVAGRVVWFYLGKLLWPANLTFIYPRWSTDAGGVWAFVPLAGALVVGAALVLLARWRRGPLAAALIFVGTLFPVLGFLNVYPFKYSFVADHFQYLASLAVVVPIAHWLMGVPSRFGRTTLTAGLVVALTVVAAGQARWYRNSETLYRNTLARNPACWMAAENLANQLSATPARLAEAIDLYRVALRDSPDPWSVHYNLANALARLPDRRAAAADEYRLALKLRPDWPAIHENFGNLLLTSPERVADAIEQYRQALRLAPNSARTEFNLGHALLRRPEATADAIAAFQAALALDPTLAAAHNELGVALARDPARTAQAIAEYDEALRLNPEFAEAYYNRAMAIVHLHGATSAAIVDFESALKYAPDVPSTHFNLAVALMDQPGRAADAVEHFQTALRLDPRLAQAQYALGVLFATRLGDRRRALAHFEAALRIDPRLNAARQWADRLRRE